jgi:subtilisin-like proprotein convertase family protein
MFARFTTPRIGLHKTGILLSRWTVRQMGDNVMKHTLPIHARLLAVTLLCALLLLTGGAVARAQTTLIDEFDNTRTAFNESSFPCSVPLVYRLTFHDDFTISKVEFDFVAAHTYRGDVRVTLISPAGTQVLAVQSLGDNFDNFNIRVADDAVDPVNNGLNDNPDLATRRLVRPAAPLSVFNGQNAQGVWQVQICDAYGGDSGEHRLSQLRLFGAAQERARPIGYWPLDESSSGATPDLAAFNRLGALRNGPQLTNATPPGIQFTNANALRFDGIDDFVEVAFPTGNLRSFTVAFWAKREAINRSDWIVGRGTGVQNEGLHIGFRSTNVFTCGFWFNDLDSPAYTDTDWHHWACSYNHETNQRTIFRDGVAVAQDIAAADYLGRSGNLMIGRLLGYGEFFRGSLDDIRLHPRALAGGEVATLASGVVGACAAQLPNGTVYTSTPLNPFALQDAVDNAPAGAVVKVAGACTGVQVRNGQAQTVHVNKSLSLVGGFTPGNWDTPDPRTQPTTLNAQGFGRVVVVPSGVTASLIILRLPAVARRTAPMAATGPMAAPAAQVQRAVMALASIAWACSLSATARSTTMLPAAAAMAAMAALATQVQMALQAFPVAMAVRAGMAVQAAWGGPAAEARDL